MYNKAQVIVDLEEYTDLKKTIETLQAPSGDKIFTEAELQDATGRLLYVALTNPQIFRSASMIDLGSGVIANITSIALGNSDKDRMMVKFTKK